MELMPGSGMAVVVLVVTVLSILGGLAFYKIGTAFTNLINRRSKR